MRRTLIVIGGVFDAFRLRKMYPLLGFPPDPPYPRGRGLLICPYVCPQLRAELHEIFPVAREGGRSPLSSFWIRSRAIHGLLSLMDHTPSKVIERHRRTRNSYKVGRIYESDFFESPSIWAV